MMPPSDELRRLWNSDSGSEGAHAAELLRRLERTTRVFNRTIRYRDLRETVAGAVVAAVFLWLASRDRTPLERAAHLWLAACGVWVVYYLWRYVKMSRKPAPDQTLLTYQQALLERFDRQIRLLKSAKYWYVFPFWIGFLFSAVAILVRTGSVAAFGLMVACVSLASAAIWWLNDVAGVRYLRDERRKVEALTEEK